MAAPPPPPPPPASGGGGGGGGGDLEAVEGIPRDTLVALLRRKDKEAKGFAAKLEKLEERYVKVVRFNKILMEDRTSFQRLCSELLPESDGAFEEAAAQETPVNLEALLRQLSSWRGALENAREDHRVFRQFMEMVFPGDAEVDGLFEAEVMGPDATDTLQRRWAELEDLHNQSIASVNAWSREQMLVRAADLEEVQAARKEAERKNAELTEQLTQLHRQKAKELTQRLGGDGSKLGSNGADPTADAGARDSGAGGQQLRELREALDAAERREREGRAAAGRLEEELRGTLDAHQAEVQRLRREMERLSDEGERHRAQARKLAEEKDATADRHRSKVQELEQELNSNAFIAQMAEHQAGRDAEVRGMKRQVEQVTQSMAEVQRLLALSYSQERVLKDQIRELDGSHSRGHVAGDYLKHVVLKYMEYTQVGDLKAQGLVPVLCTLLSLNPEERRQVENPSIPQPLLLINQAVGGASSWLRGATGPSAGSDTAGAPGQLLGAGGS
mmetsp:Transcript_131694/g.421336  ORF Transcript_131694/g.421336 Transcript_131694/m.421336 type:complete len:503 (-) Transcript_131694:83-1591(-)